jgi:hypothetical protein
MRLIFDQGGEGRLDSIDDTERLSSLNHRRSSLKMLDCPSIDTYHTSNHSSPRSSSDCSSPSSSSKDARGGLEDSLVVASFVLKAQAQEPKSANMERCVVRRFKNMLFPSYELHDNEGRLLIVAKKMKTSNYHFFDMRKRKEKKISDN